MPQVVAFDARLEDTYAALSALLLTIAAACVQVSSGSACTSASLEPSYVLRALGVDEEMAHTSIRFGLGRFTTSEEVRYPDRCSFALLLGAALGLCPLRPGWCIDSGVVDACRLLRRASPCDSISYSVGSKLTRHGRRRLLSDCVTLGVLCRPNTRCGWWRSMRAPWSAAAVRSGNA